MKKLEIIILTGFIIAAISLTCIKIGIATLFTTSGTQYSIITEQTKNFETENVILKEKILNQSSLFTIASKAATLGFTYPKKDQRLAITHAAPFAYKQ